MFQKIQMNYLDRIVFLYFLNVSQIIVTLSKVFIKLKKVNAKKCIKRLKKLFERKHHTISYQSYASLYCIMGILEAID